LLLVTFTLSDPWPLKTNLPSTPALHRQGELLAPDCAFEETEAKVTLGGGLPV